MLKIKFDPEAAKTALFEGPFESRAALIEACEVVDLPHPAYEQWAEDNGIHGGFGLIYASAYSPHYIKRRLATLEGQLKDFANGTETTGLKFTVPPMLTAAFQAAAENQKPDTQFRMLTISNTRETLYFNLRKAFPQINLHATCASANTRQTVLSNEMIAKQPGLTQNLTYTSKWQNQPYDLVHVNAAIFYNDENGVKNTILQIAATGAERVVFNNIINSSGDKAEWFAQRSMGGVVPMRALPPEEITALMQQACYRLVDRNKAPATYDVRTSEVETSKLLNNDNLFFVRDHAPA